MALTPILKFKPVAKTLSLDSAISIVDKERMYVNKLPLGETKVTVKLGSIEQKENKFQKVEIVVALHVQEDETEFSKKYSTILINYDHLTRPILKSFKQSGEQSLITLLFTVTKKFVDVDGVATERHDTQVQVVS